jgi:hypothetical protein
LAIYLDPLQINGIHHGALKKLDGGGVPLQQAFQLQIGFFPVSHTSNAQQETAQFHFQIWDLKKNIGFYLVGGLEGSVANLVSNQGIKNSIQ